MARVTDLNGVVMEVESLGRAFTLEVNSKLDQTLSNRGHSISILVDTTSADNADDYVLYFQNIGPVVLGIGTIDVMASDVTTLWFDEVLGTPTFTAGVDTQETNRLLGSPNDPVLLSQYDTDIGGLIPFGRLFFERCALANRAYRVNEMGGMALPFSTAFAMRSSNPAAIITLKMTVNINDY